MILKGNNMESPRSVYSSICESYAYPKHPCHKPQIDLIDHDQEESSNEKMVLLLKVPRCFPSNARKYHQDCFRQQSHAVSEQNKHLSSPIPSQKWSLRALEEERFGDCNLQLPPLVSADKSHLQAKPHWSWPSLGYGDTHEHHPEPGVGGRQNHWPKI